MVLKMSKRALLPFDLESRPVHHRTMVSRNGRILLANSPDLPESGD